MRVCPLGNKRNCFDRSADHFDEFLHSEDLALPACANTNCFKTEGAEHFKTHRHGKKATIIGPTPDDSQVNTQASAAETDSVQKVEVKTRRRRTNATNKRCDATEQRKEAHKSAEAIVKDINEGHSAGIRRTLVIYTAGLCASVMVLVYFAFFTDMMNTLEYASAAKSIKK